MCRFAPWSRAPIGSPVHAGRRRDSAGAFRTPVPARYGFKPGFGRELSRFAEFADAHELLADLADVARGAVGPLGDHAVGLVRAAAQLELEQCLAPGGPAVTVGADGRLLDGLLALAVQTEPLA